MAAPITRFDKHSGKIAFAFWLLVIVGGIAILEWSLTPANGRYRAYGSASGPGPARALALREWEPLTDYRFTPVPERIRYPNGGIRGTYDLATDENGFIKPAARHEKPDVTVVFMGGSTTECLYVAPENRFPVLAAQKLETDLGLKINGINAARSGNNTVHSLLILIGKVISLRPDYVVYMEAANDFGVMLANGDYWAARGSHEIINHQKISLDQFVRLLTNALVPYTSDLVGRAWRPVRNLFRGGSVQAASHTRHARPGGRAIDQEAIGRDFSSALKSFVAVARAWGITPVLMTQVNVLARSDQERESSFLAREQPDGARISPENFATTHDYFNAIIREVARSENVLLIDLARARDWSFGDVYDSVHFTDEGSRKVADVILEKLGDEIAKRNAIPRTSSHAGR
jgi:lysophospholipase L1-like esterase